jgi:hypothetical protein
LGEVLTGKEGAGGQPPSSAVEVVVEVPCGDAVKFAGRQAERGEGRDALDVVGMRVCAAVVAEAAPLLSPPALYAEPRDDCFEKLGGEVAEETHLGGEEVLTFCQWAAMAMAEWIDLVNSTLFLK